MFESIEKTGHNHALPETDRESYLQTLRQASPNPGAISPIHYPGLCTGNIKDTQIP